MSYLKTSWKRWLSWLVVAILFAIACVFLSRWQFDRRAEVVAKNQLISGNYDQSPISPDELFSQGKFEPAQEWRPVELTGHYLSMKPLLVRNKPYAGNQGFLEVAVFQTADLKLYLIDRGWLPTGSTNDLPDSIPTPPSGHIQIQGRVRATESIDGRDAPRGQLAAVNPVAAAKQLGVKEPIVNDYYIRLSGESPAPATYPQLEAMPELSEGNHLSYAIQWIIFAVLAFVTLGYFIRQEREHYLVATQPGYQPKQRRVRRSQLDEQIEDAL